MSGKALIKVFQGGWRGLGNTDNETGLGMILDFDFRDYLNQFPGAMLHVFMAIVMHTDKDGKSFPSYDLLVRETGYRRDTIASALDKLCGLEIDGHRVLLRYRERDEKGQFTGSNRYLVFPKPEEVTKYDDSGQSQKNRTVATQSQKNPTMDKPTSGKPDSKINHSKDNPSIKLKDTITPDGVSVSDEDRANLEWFEKNEKPQAPRRSAEENKASVAQTLAKTLTRGSERYDLSTYPEGLRAYAKVFAECWKIDPPVKLKGKGGGQYAFWIQGLMQLQDACGEFGPQAVKEYYDRWDADRRKKGTVPFTVGHPGALVKVVTALVGEKRQGGERPSGHTDDIITLAKEDWPAFLAAAKEVYMRDSTEFALKIKPHVSLAVGREKYAEMERARGEWNREMRAAAEAKYRAQESASVNVRG